LKFLKLFPIRRKKVLSLHVVKRVIAFPGAALLAQSAPVDDCTFNEEEHC
jgi:hypothetical protein